MTSSLNVQADRGRPRPYDSSVWSLRSSSCSSRLLSTSGSAGPGWSRPALWMRLRARFTARCPTAGVGNRSASSAPTTTGRRAHLLGHEAEATTSGCEPGQRHVLSNPSGHLPRQPFCGGVTLQAEILHRPHEVVPLCPVLDRVAGRRCVHQEPPCLIVRDRWQADRSGIHRVTPGESALAGDVGVTHQHEIGCAPGEPSCCEHVVGLIKAESRSVISSRGCVHEEHADTVRQDHAVLRWQ